MAIENFHCIQNQYIIITLRLFAFLPLRVCILSEKSSLLKSGDFSLSFEMIIPLSLRAFFARSLLLYSQDAYCVIVRSRRRLGNLSFSNLER